GSEVLAEAIANECLSEYLRRYHPETSLAEVQRLEQDAPKGTFGELSRTHAGIGFAGKFGLFTLRAQDNFDCRAEHPGGSRTVCNAPFDQHFIEEDWPYWRNEWGKARVEFDRMWAEELRKRDYRRRWLKQLPATSERKPLIAEARTSPAATQNDDAIPDFDVDNMCAKAYGTTEIQGI